MLENKKNAIVRLVVLVILMANQAMVTFGFNPLPFSEEQIFEGVSVIATGAMAIYTWWKNNDTSDEGVAGTEKTKALKNNKKK